MRELLKWIEAAFAATAFAEENEPELARRILAERGRGESGGSDAPAPRSRGTGSRPWKTPARVARVP